MPSGKRARQGRRATVPPPPVRAGGAPGARKASPRVLGIAAGVVVVIAIAVVLAVVLTGGKSSPSTASIPTTGSIANGLPGAASVYAEFKGIPQAGLFLGTPSAPARMVEYIDLQCPYCREFETEVMPSIVAKYVRTGKLEVEARTLAFIGPDSTRGRNGMIAAGLQDQAFDFAQLLYDNQQTENTGWLNDAMVTRAAESMPGVNPRLLIQQSSTGEVAKIAARIDAQGKADSVAGTPTILVGKAGAQPKYVSMKSPTDAATLTAAIEAALH